MEFMIMHSIACIFWNAIVCRTWYLPTDYSRNLLYK